MRLVAEQVVPVLVEEFRTRVVLLLLAGPLVEGPPLTLETGHLP